MSRPEQPEKDGPGESQRLSESSVGTLPSEPSPLEPQITGVSRGQGLLERYTVLGQLGQGATSVVLSVYDARLDRRVALKLMRGRGEARSSGSEGAGHFLSEAQAMARLSHPNVVAVYDAGLLEDGSLFIAMEHVEGQTLRVWQRQRPWREVLNQFLAAGRGLMAAHEAGLIHRDFKPDNVLVGQDGRVRVTDFGLAQLESPLESSSISSGDRAGTPFYMAAEQLQGQRADARSDLYAFCVSLYEALYGELPFRGGTVKELLEAQRTGRAVPPEGSGVPTWVGQTVLRGLSVDPAQRPASLRELLAALRDDPEVRRRAWLNRAAVASVTLVLAGLAFWGGVLHQAPTCDRVDQQLAGVWDAAVKARVEEALLATGVPYARATTERVAAALDGYARAWVGQRTELCLRASDEGPSQAQGLILLRDSCLERRRSQLRALTELLSQAPDRELVDKAVQAAQALPPLAYCADAKALTAAVPPPEDPAVREKVEALQVQVDRMEALLESGKYKKGLTEAEGLLPQLEAVGHAPLLGRALYLAARLRGGTGDSPGAEQWLYKAMTAAATARDMSLLARIWVTFVSQVGDKQGRYQEALLLRPALENMVEVANEDPIRASALNILSTIFWRLGKYDQAEQLCERALELRLKTGGPESVEVATSYNTLGGILISMGKYEEARDRFARALELREKILGPEHPHVASVLANLGRVSLEMGRLEEARQLQLRALALFEKTLGPEHPTVGATLNNLGNILKKMGRFEEAREIQTRVLALWEKTLGPEHPDVVVALNNLGVTLVEMGKHEEARQTFVRALALRQKAVGPEHPDIAGSLSNLGEVLRNMGRYAEAHEQYTRAMAVLDKALPPDHPERTFPLLGLGDLLRAQHRPAEALPYLERALKLASELTRAEVQFSLAQALWESRRDRPRALELATQARDSWERQGQKSASEPATEWLKERSGGPPTGKGTDQNGPLLHVGSPPTSP